LSSLLWACNFTYTLESGVMAKANQCGFLLNIEKLYLDKMNVYLIDIDTQFVDYFGRW